MFFSNTAKGLMLDALDEGVATGWKFTSLHTAYSTTGTNELTGGSPAYARKATTWATASGGSKAMAATFPVFDVAASTTVTWFGGWDAVTAGNFLGMVPLNGGTQQACAVEVAADLTANDIYAKAHGYSAGQGVVFWGTLPTGLSVGTVYFVIATGITSDSFRVAATAGGSAVDITGTAPYSFRVQSCTPETFGAQGTLTFSSASLDLSAVA